MTKEYRGFVSFATSDVEFARFKEKVNRYYNWCGTLRLDPTDDENYNAFCEGDSVYQRS